MAQQITQIEKDGTRVLDFDPDQVPFADQEDIIRTGLQDRGWTVDFLQGDKTTRRRLFKIEKGGETLHVITYIFSNLAWSNGNRSVDEKRIQLSRPYAEHKADFELDNKTNPRCALMGIYRRKGLTLFCAWEPSAYADHSVPSSCYIKTDAMAAAARNGIGQSTDSKGRLVCCFTPDMLAYYFENMSFLHDRIVSSDDLTMPAPEQAGAASMQIDAPPNPIAEDLSHNRIFYGAPGTGKSHNLNLDLEKHFPSEDLFERTTFYPDSTSGTFMGSYRPTPIYRDAEGAFLEADRISAAPSLEPIIDYRFVPGPFLRLLAKALANPEHNFCLVIEEINRANASAVFADAFQMLDRDDEGAGKFTVTLAPEARDYLASQGHNGPVRIPSNMYIWATMNSADQGVLPLDSAFKRRWSMEYVGLNDGEDVVKDWELELSFLEHPIKWNAFRSAINAHLERQGITEDRLLGPFFMTKKDLARPKAFENKLLQYLRDDVVRNAPGKLFAGGSSTFGALVQGYREKNNIFVPEIVFGGS